MKNYRFNIDDWLPRFPLDLNADRYAADIITGPCHICINELLRRELEGQYDWGTPVPMDIFVMAEGEPYDRHVTKLGGLPYRPARSPWPETSSGDAKVFVAQFNFCDSTDITGDLPGEILLVFGDGSSGHIESLTFEWQRLGIEDLVTAEAIPKQLGSFDPCYGHIYRSVSFPDAKEKPSVRRQRGPTCRGKFLGQSYLLPLYQATQIGSAPFFTQRDPGLPGRILCTISSVQPDQHRRFPWINHPQSLMPEGKWNRHLNYLMIDDMGCFYISIDENSQLHWHESGY